MFIRHLKQPTCPSNDIFMSIYLVWIQNVYYSVENNSGGILILRNSVFYEIPRDFTEFRNWIPAESNYSVKFRRNSVVRNPARHSTYDCVILNTKTSLGNLFIPIGLSKKKALLVITNPVNSTGQYTIFRSTPYSRSPGK